MSFPLHLLRHGAPEREGLLLGRTDAAPTAEGIARCRARVAALDRDAPIALVSSDLARAADAAEAIGPDIGIVPTIDPRWRELDFGEWDGHPPDEIDPAALARFHDDPDGSPPPGGERWSALSARVAAAIAAMPPRPTLVVTHGGAIRAALGLLCRLDPHQAWAVDLPYAALLSLRVWPGPPPMAQITGLRG